MAGTNYDKLIENIKDNKKPFIVYDIETTGAMNGNDNRITQIALTSYDYNKQENRYELQDKIFMLAKVDKDVIENIQKQEAPTEENAKNKLLEEYLYSAKRKIKDCLKRIDNAETKSAEAQKNLDNFKKGIPETYTDKSGKTRTVVHTEAFYQKQIADATEKIASEKNTLTQLQNNADLTEESINMIKTGVSSKSPDFISLTVEMQDKIKDIEDMLDKLMLVKIDELKASETVLDILAHQGTNIKDITDGLGLTNSELQIGISKFLDTYKKDNTVFVNNGTYFANHYLEKQGLIIAKENDTVIDMTQADRSRYGNKSDNQWTSDISAFASNYKADTGKEIKIFDALTKSLCIGEMVMKATENKLINTSEKYLENCVKEQALAKDEDYVLSAARASTLDWMPDFSDSFIHADFHFNSLDYVDFGNDRRYVDIDKMFEVNENFEITLEGEKTPIKTWEELEAKIKSLNANISQELLNKIHDKYVEIEKEATKQAEVAHIATSFFKEIEEDEEPQYDDDDYDYESDIEDTKPTYDNENDVMSSETPTLMSDVSSREKENDNEQKYDIAFLKDNVFIGMEDVSITYGLAEKKEGLTFRQVLSELEKGFFDYNTNEQVLKERENRPYYPNAHNVPVKLVVAKSGELFIPVNYSQLRETKHYDFSDGAKEDGFKQNVEKLKADFDQKIKTKIISIYNKHIDNYMTPDMDMKPMDDKMSALDKVIADIEKKIALADVLKTKQDIATLKEKQFNEKVVPMMENLSDMVMKMDYIYNTLNDNLKELDINGFHNLGLFKDYLKKIGDANNWHLESDIIDGERVPQISISNGSLYTLAKKRIDNKYGAENSYKQYYKNADTLIKNYKEIFEIASSQIIESINKIYNNYQLDIDAYKESLDKERSEYDRD